MESTHIHAVAVVDHPQRCKGSLFFRWLRQQYVYLFCLGIVSVGHKLLDGLVWTSIEALGEQSNDVIIDRDGDFFDLFAGVLQS